MSRYVIDEILKKRKITEYLASKGYNPIGSEVNGKYRYKCPLHQGDNTPSFMVYTNGEFENFYCYGCKARYHIVHLYRDLEKVTLKEAVKILSNGLNLDLDSELSFIIREIEEDQSQSSLFTPVDYSLIISRQVYDFTKLVQNDREEVNRAEKLLQLVDVAVDNCDLEGLKTVYDSLETVIPQRVALFEQEKEQKLRKALTS